MNRFKVLRTIIFELTIAKVLVSFNWCNDEESEMMEKRDMISANDLLVDSNMESGNDVKAIDEWLHILEISDIWLRRKIYSNKWWNLVEKQDENMCVCSRISCGQL